MLLLLIFFAFLNLKQSNICHIGIPFSGCSLLGLSCNCFEWMLISGAAPIPFWWAQCGNLRVKSVNCVHVHRRTHILIPVHTSSARVRFWSLTTMITTRFLGCGPEEMQTTQTVSESCSVTFSLKHLEAPGQFQLDVSFTVSSVPAPEGSKGSFLLWNKLPTLFGLWVLHEVLLEGAMGFKGFSWSLAEWLAVGQRGHSRAQLPGNDTVEPHVPACHSQQWPPHEKGGLCPSIYDLNWWSQGENNRIYFPFGSESPVLLCAYGPSCLASASWHMAESEEPGPPPGSCNWQAMWRMWLRLVHVCLLALGF